MVLLGQGGVDVLPLGLLHSQAVLVFGKALLVLRYIRLLSIALLLPLVTAQKLGSDARIQGADLLPHLLLLLVAALKLLLIHIELGHGGFLLLLQLLQLRQGIKQLLQAALHVGTLLAQQMHGAKVCAQYGGFLRPLQLFGLRGKGLQQLLVLRQLGFKIGLLCTEQRQALQLLLLHLQGVQRLLLLLLLLFLLGLFLLQLRQLLGAEDFHALQGGL